MREREREGGREYQSSVEFISIAKVESIGVIASFTVCRNIEHIHIEEKLTRCG
jgi:hypothetical protein